MLQAGAQLILEEGGVPKVTAGFAGSFYHCPFSKYIPIDWLFFFSSLTQEISNSVFLQ